MKSVRRTKITAKPSEGGTKDAQGLGARTVSAHSLRGNLASETVHENDAGDDWLPPKVLLKPQNQLALTDLELDEELTRILNANNPHAPQNISRYSVKEGTYKTVSNLDHLVLHYEFDGYMVYKNIDDANISTTSTGTSTDPTSSESPAKSLEDGGGPDRLGTAVSGAEGGSGEAASGEGEGTAVFDETAAGKAKKGPQRNQFNFSERASQTINNPHRVRSTNTEPPPQRTFSHGVNQWTIYDAYCDDLLLKEKSAKEKAKSQPVAGKGHRDEDKQAVLPSDGQHTSEDVYWKNPEFKKSIVIVERMANQNTYDEITHDYKYWEDASDEFREGKSGSLLPLWKFQFEKDKKKQITGLCWNRFKPDLFAVSYGSYDFSRQGPGLVACFSFKNASFPEFIYSTDSGVMCIDFHPTIPSLLAAGLYDGTVLVFDLRKGGKEGSPGNSFCAVSYGSGSSATLAPAPAPNAGTGVGAGTGAGAAGGGGAQKGGAAGVGGAGGGTVGASLANGAEKRGEPVFRSGARSGKHTDPVWQVAWQPDNLDGNSNFFSVSGDGRVTQWTLVKNELIHTDVIRLHLSESTFRPPASLQDRNLIGGMIGMNEDVFNSASSTVAQAAQAIVDDDDKRLFKVAGGSCFDFHRTEPHLFIVGTEEGQIHKCSTAYSNQFMLSFEGHKMGVYQVRYNPFWSEVFLSASADWTLKLWHHGKSKPLMTFDLNASVGDVAWSPYSSTVFAAITSDGKVYVYDLDINKNEPLCDQPIVHKAKLTHISFSITDPVVLVGDDKGVVTSLKLSPNLRKVREKDPAEQVEKLQKVLAPSMSTGAEVGA